MFFALSRPPRLLFSSTLLLTCQLKVPDMSAYKLPPGVNVKGRDPHHYIISAFFK